MSFDTGGYRRRWIVPYTDRFSQPRRLVVSVTEDKRGVRLTLPGDSVCLDTETANQLAQDIRDAAREARSS
ncbi:MAG TPA: hypothetical protein VHV49_18005 [Pseudonocardiaceae bacterium]|nr:hypothetical protein [Pseudonocardiaceae bacterium]